MRHEKHDGDLEDLDDISTLDAIADFDKVKRYYEKYHIEKREDDIYVINLQKKLEKLRQDLDARTESVESLQRSLVIEKQKQGDEDKSIQRERKVKANAQEERIRDHLSEVLYAKPSGGAANDLDTVMVSYRDPTKSMRYNLAFRVDGQTSVRELKTSACRYWGQAQEEYVLKTMASNKCQDDIKVADCFRQGELAQLRLERKEKNPTEKPTDDEFKAIQGKGKSGQRKSRRAKKDTFDTSQVEAARKQQDSRDTDMKKMGGTYFLLKKRDTKASEHRSKIKINDMLLYGVLLFLCIYSYSVRRPAANSFWFLRGFNDYLSRRTVVGDRTIPRFQDLTDRDQVNDWMEHTLADLFYGNDTLRVRMKDYNVLFGYMGMRVQLVRPPDSPLDGCEESTALVEELLELGAHCKPNEVDETTEETRTFAALREDWFIEKAKGGGQTTGQLRGPNDPSMWQPHEYLQNRSGIQSFQGYFQTYDASGYLAEYRMDIADGGSPLENFRRDLLQFRRFGWLASHTRVLFLSFTAYNFDYDLWISANLVLELPDSGAVIPQMQLLVFQPQIMETRSELQTTYMDYARVAIALYILIVVGQYERHHKIKNHLAGCWYHVSLNGICDLGAVFCIFIAVFWRRALQTSVSTSEWMSKVADIRGTEGLYSLESEAKVYEAIMSVEGLLIVFLMYRLISFLRIFRSIYLLWHAIGTAFKGMFFFGLLLIPTVVGFTYQLHMVYGPYDIAYASISHSLLAVYQLLEGSLDIEPLVKQEVAWAIVILSTFYFLMNYVLLGVFSAIVIDGYYVAQLVDGGPGENFRWRKWLVPNVIWSIYQRTFKGQGSEGT